MMPYPNWYGYGCGYGPTASTVLYRYQHNNVHNAGTMNVNDNGNEEQIHFVRPLRGFNYGDS